MPDQPVGGGTEPTQLLLGHADTVWPLGTLGSRPWSVEDGVARGPGVFDMKAGIVQILFALRTVRDLGLDPPATPLVLINSDEEIGSRESTLAIDRLSRVASRAFVCEPGLGSSGAMKTARKGLAKYTSQLTDVPRMPASIPKAARARFLNSRP